MTQTIDKTTQVVISNAALDVLWKALQARRESGDNQATAALATEINGAAPYKSDRKMLNVTALTFGTLLHLTKTNQSAHKGLASFATKLEAMAENFAIVDADGVVAQDVSMPDGTEQAPDEEGPTLSTATDTDTTVTTETPETPETPTVVEPEATAPAAPVDETTGATPDAPETNGTEQTETVEAAERRHRGDDLYLRDRTYARTSGAEMAVYDSWHPDSTFPKGEKDERYVTACLTHNASARSNNTREARRKMRYPEEFCATCKTTAAGSVKNRRAVKREIKGIVTPSTLPEGTVVVTAPAPDEAPVASAEAAVAAPVETPAQSIDEATEAAEAALAAPTQSETPVAAPVADAPPAAAPARQHPSDEQAPASAWEKFRAELLAADPKLTDVAWTGDLQYMFEWGEGHTVEVIVKRADFTETYRAKGKTFEALSDAREVAGA